MFEQTNITTFLTLPEVQQIGDGEEEFGHWYDWFCTNGSTLTRGRKLMSKLRGISKSKRFDPNTTYVWFKNNCPMSGKLYDDFRIADCATQNNLFTITPSSGHLIDKGIGSVWGRAHPDDKEYVELFKGSWAEIKRWFNEYDPEAK